jgi:formiminotetrahydrofolate cyclodeaminase
MRASADLAPNEASPHAPETSKTTATDFVEAVASADPVPGGGSVAAYAGALSAALIRMVAGLTLGRKKYAAVESEMTVIAGNAHALAEALSRLVERDAQAYAAVAAAYKIPKDAESRNDAIQTALLGAAEVPLETARLCAQAAALAAAVAAKGNSNAVTDAGVAALLAEAGCRGADYNVRVDVGSITDRTRGAALAAQAAELVRAAAQSAKEACAEVESGLTH